MCFYIGDWKLGRIVRDGMECRINLMNPNSISSSYFGFIVSGLWAREDGPTFLIFITHSLDSSLGFLCHPLDLSEVDQ